MKRSENGIVTPFEKFAWDSSKGKLAIKLSPKAIETLLLLYIEFGKNSERFCLGEEKSVRQIADDPVCISKHKWSVLMMSGGTSAREFATGQLHFHNRQSFKGHKHIPLYAPFDRQRQQ